MLKKLINKLINKLMAKNEEIYNPKNHIKNNRNNAINECNFFIVRSKLY